MLSLKKVNELADDDQVEAERTGGFGSSGQK